MQIVLTITAGTNISPSRTLILHLSHERRSSGEVRILNKWGIDVHMISRHDDITAIVAKVVMELCHVIGGLEQLRYYY